MKYLKLFEINKLKYYIDVRNSSDDEKMKILNLLEEISPTIFNWSDSKKEFINKRDTQGLAWCWKVEKSIDKFYISGIHTYNWGMPEIGEKMLTGKEFIDIGPQNVEMFFTLNKYNL